ncbi:MAG: NAD(P)/FAD-dependent oxidoreductase [Bacillota bacterium]
MLEGEKYQVTIVGGGPAGSTAAAYLSDYGFSVCLIEKKVFPRETLCGEFLSKEVTAILDELDIKDHLFSLGANPVTSIRFVNQNGGMLVSPLGFIGYGLKRGAFDQLLLENAVKKGAAVIQPAEVKNISKENEKNYRLIILNKNGQPCSIRTNIVIGAYGKKNFLDKELNREQADSVSRFNGIKFHFPLNIAPKFPLNEIQIYTAEGIYCGLNAVNDRILTVCFLEDRNCFKGSSRDHLRLLMEKNISFKELFLPEVSKIIECAPIYGTGNIFFGRKDLSVNGVIMIGDAARVIAPLAGDGIAMAMQSGKLIADIVSKNFTSPAQKMEKLYKVKWNAEFSKRIFAARLIQSVIMNKKLNQIALNIGRIFPALLNFLVRSTRE